MLLALDVGNTNLTCGVFDGERLLHSFRMTTRLDRTSDELALDVLGALRMGGVDASKLRALVVGSVVPPLRRVLQEMATRRLGLKPLWVEPGIRTGMPLLSENPQEVGADRITNGVAAYARFGGPVVVVDFGTATTFDVISGAGEYLGGVIAPGLLISAEALSSRAARLPGVALERPATVIGRNTVHCMQSGLFHGYVALVEGLLARILGELGTAARVIATGGLADSLADELHVIDEFEPDLTLEGLRLLHELNPR